MKDAVDQELRTNAMGMALSVWRQQKFIGEPNELFALATKIYEFLNGADIPTLSPEFETSGYAVSVEPGAPPTYVPDYKRPRYDNPATEPHPYSNEGYARDPDEEIPF